MVHLRYDMNKQTVLRAAITRTYRRPNFIETKPGAPIINYTNLEYNIGNPNLKPSFAWNLDLSYEYYMKNAGLATLGLFGKLVQDHIYRTITADADPQQGIVYKSYQNAKKPIFVLGVELNFKKKLDFFKNGLKDLGVDVNTSYIYSRMKLPGRSFAQSLPMQPSVLFNAALFYENDKTGLFARIAVNYTGKYLMELNTSAVVDANNQPKLLHDNTDFDVFMKDRWGMDFNVGWKINRHFQVYAELANLLNTPLYIYRGKEYRPMQVEYYSFKANIGLKLNF
jgi:TonB-dependent receptor